MIDYFRYLCGTKRANELAGGKGSEWTLKRLCKQCDRLWKAYTDATKACLALVEELRVATLANDSVAMLELTPKLDQA